jgi:signal transduction histidine kinase
VVASREWYIAGVAIENVVEPSAPPSRRRFGALGYAIALAALATAYVAAGEVGFSMAFATRQVSAVWPPTGIAVTALLLFGSRLWPAITVGAFVLNATSHEHLLTAAGIAAGNTAGPVIGAELLRRFAVFDPGLARVRDVLSLVAFASMGAMTITATNGVAQLAWAGIVSWSRYSAVWPVWWVGDAMGVLLVAPVLLTWSRVRPTRAAHTARGPLRWAPVVERIVFVPALGFGCTGVLAGNGQLQYLVYPFVAWAGLRFEQRETAATVFVISAVAIWEAIHQRGPFTTGTLDHRLILLEIFMAVTAVMGLVLGAMTTERRSVARALEEARAELETRVAERTAALAAANAELAGANAELRRRGRDLSEKNDEMERFVYIVSHDLRTPLMTLQGFSDELARSCVALDTALTESRAPVDPGPLSLLRDEIPSALRFIRASGNKFERLIDALLRLSRLGRTDHRPERVDVAALVQSTLDSLRQLIEQSGGLVQVGELPDAWADPTTLGQVFSNLVANAIHYRSAERPIVISIQGKAEGRLLHYSVSDNGVGIPEVAQERLFQVFQRFHPKLAEGDGMGLTIVKRAVERHGGNVWAESRESMGTTFHFSLPARGSEP